MYGRENFGSGAYASEAARRGSYSMENGRFTGKGPKGYQRSDDRIREDICERLT